MLLDMAARCIARTAAYRAIPFRKIHNRRCSLDRLPNELLLPIFRDVVNEDSRDYYHHLHEIAQVCKRWSMVVKRSPQLWTYIHTGNPISLIRKAMVMSGQLPLHIDFSTVWCADDGSKPMAAVVPHIPRWRSIVTRVIGDCPVSLESSPAPQLVSFKIHRPHRWNGPVQFFQGHVPVLRQLSLDSIPFRQWDTLSLPCLRSLKLNAIHEHGPSVTEILHILEFSPALEDLSLVDIKFSRDGAELGRDASLVRLAQLKYCRITIVDSTAMHNLLRYIQAPNCTTWHVSNRQGIWGDFMLPLAATTLATASRTKIILEGQRKLSIIITPVGPDSQPLTIHIADTYLKEYLPWLEDLPFPKNVPIDLECDKTYQLHYSTLR